MLEALDYTLLIVLSGSLLIGFVAGTLGSFAFLRKQSLLGDTISHAALPGVALAFLLTLSKHPLVLLLGALAAGWIGTLLILLITRSTRLKQDSAMGIVLAVFFGLGVFLLSIIQRLPTSRKAGLETFLFGNASTLLRQDVLVIGVFGMIALLLVALFWKEFKALTFDPAFAKSLGFPTFFLDVFLTTLIVLAIVLGLQAVGVVLMSALVIAPAAAARQWTDRMGLMVLLSGALGAIGGVAGGLLSSRVSNLPTGPTIVLFISLFVLVSLFLSPHRGLLTDWLSARRNRKRVRVVRVLLGLFSLAQSHEDPFRLHPVESLKAGLSSSVEEGLRELQKMRYAAQREGRWKLTPKGLSEARRISREMDA